MSLDLEEWFSHNGDIASQETLFGNVRQHSLLFHLEGGGYYWHLVDRGHGYC